MEERADTRPDRPAARGAFFADPEFPEGRFAASGEFNHQLQQWADHRDELVDHRMAAIAVAEAAYRAHKIRPTAENQKALNDALVIAHTATREVDLAEVQVRRMAS